jgi:D-alanine--poly(phosphoribitol) ligase subunit 1
MTMLPDRIRQSLTKDRTRTVIEDASGQWSLTGAQLLADAAGLLDCLAEHADRPLVIYLRKSPLYYAFLTCAFLYALDFCPLDAENPTRRVLDVADQLPGSMIVCDRQDVFARLCQHTDRCLNLEVPQMDVEREAGTTRCANGACYYIATSGSAGTPKLVQVPHGRTLAFLDWAIPFYEVDEDTRWGQFCSIGFDLSLVDFLTVICGGGTLVSISAQMDRMRPARAVARSRLTHWHSVPSMIPYFLREPENADGLTCRLFTFCGEPFMREDAVRLAARYPGARIVNTYGPTEATLFCSFFEYKSDSANFSDATLPVGQAIPSWNFVLMPEGDCFRLFILSDNIATGYVNVPSTQFTTVPLFGREMRAFDTGDYFRRVGTHLHFSHRKDMMVKINGLRIDLGEIESAAKRCGFLNPVAFVVDKIIVLSAEATVDAPQDVGALAEYLPRASMPATICLVSAHPRTVSGKLDRHAIRVAFGATHDD